MAYREVRKKDDDVLSKVCKEVKNFDKKLEILLDDMYDTMKKCDGVGLAAPQIGILKRVCVIDVGEGKIEFINPVITKTSGSQIGSEGCLSVPGVYGDVERPEFVTVKALDRHGKEFEISGEGLLARAFCHEIDHLDGHLYVEKVEGELHDVTYEEEDFDEE